MVKIDDVKEDYDRVNRPSQKQLQNCLSTLADKQSRGLQGEKASHRCHMYMP